MMFPKFAPIAAENLSLYALGGCRRCAVSRRATVAIRAKPTCPGCSAVDFTLVRQGGLCACGCDV